MIKGHIEHFDARAAWLALPADVQERVGAAALDLAMGWEVGVAAYEGAADERMQRAALAGECVAADELSAAFEAFVPDDLKRAGDAPRVPASVGLVCRSCGCSETDACAGGCEWVDGVDDLCTACLPSEASHG